MQSVLILSSRRFISGSRVIAQAASAGGAKPEVTPSGDPKKTFYHKDLQITHATGDQLHAKPKDWNAVPFGHVFSDHMMVADWSAFKGWTAPVIEPIKELSLHPGAKVLHYASELFEGMKAYRGVDNKIRLFRPELNMERMRRSAVRASLPDFDTKEFIKIIAELVRTEREWVPYSETASMYLRPTLIGTEGTLGVANSSEAKMFVLASPVGPYYQTGFKPVRLLADKTNCRAFPGGVGAFKMGCNYAPTIEVTKKAGKDHGCQQVMWLYGDDEQVTEAGTMNMFMLWKNTEGDMELVTPPLESGLILPGVTRQSLLELARSWGEVKVTERSFTMTEVIEALKEERLYEMFGAGTAAVVSPVGEIIHRRGNEYVKMQIPTMSSKSHLMQKLWQTITDIQYGRAEMDGWTVVV